MIERQSMEEKCWFKGPTVARLRATSIFVARPISEQGSYSNNSLNISIKTSNRTTSPTISNVLINFPHDASSTSTHSPRWILSLALQLR
jgi:hypothetical protein